MKIFVGSIRNIVTEQELRELFEPYGAIDAIMYKGSYAFVFMSDEDQAQTACTALHQIEIKGCKLNVEESKPSKAGDKFVDLPPTATTQVTSAPRPGQRTDPAKFPKFHHTPGRIKLIVGNIGDAAKEELQEYFEPFGTVFETFVLEGKGVGFVHVDDMKAEYMIEQTHQKQFGDKEIRVSYSVSKDLKLQKGPHTTYVKLWIPHLHESAREDILRQRFEMFGDVQEVIIIKRSHCAFLHIDAAVADYAISKLTGIPFYGNPLRPQYAKGERPISTSMLGANDVPHPSTQGYDPFAQTRDPREPLLPRDPFQTAYYREVNQPIYPRAEVPHPSTVAHHQPLPPSYPANHSLANLELGPGFGPGNQPTKLATLPPPPQGQDELRELIEKRCKLEMVHPYEKHLIESYSGNNKSAPTSTPPPEYLRLVRDRAILKIRLLRAQERGFDVYGTAMSMFQQQSQSTDPYGFAADTKPVMQIQHPVASAQIKMEPSPAYDPETAWSTNGQVAAPADSYTTAYANSAGGPIQLKKDYVPRRNPY